MNISSDCEEAKRPLEVALGAAEGSLERRSRFGLDFGDVGDPVNRVAEVVELCGDFLAPAKSVAVGRIDVEKFHGFSEAAGEQFVEAVGNALCKLEVLSG